MTDVVVDTEHSIPPIREPAMALYKPAIEKHDHEDKHCEREQCNRCRDRVRKCRMWVIMDSTRNTIEMYCMPCFHLYRYSDEQIATYTLVINIED